MLLGVFSLLVMYSCQDEVFNDINISAPQNLTMAIDVSSDESGDVTVKPQAEGASYFDIYYGDIADETPQTVQTGGIGTHTYVEGDYTIKVVAFNLDGQSIEASQVIMLRFAEPTGLMIDVSVDDINTNVVTVTPTAENATLFDIYFGDAADEEPCQIMAGDSKMHSYEVSGTYVIKVVARSGSATTIEGTESVTVEVPAKQLAFPIDFEDSEITYDFISFGNANLSKETNPDQSGNNTSANVGSLVKTAGAEVWAGGVLQLPNPIDFSQEDQFKMNVWSPKAGAAVLIKLENASDDQIFMEVQTPTTTSGSWEELSFDFSGIDKTQSYHKVVIFMDFGVNGDDSQYYFDDLRLGEGDGGNTGGNEDPLVLPVTFESSDIAYDFVDFGNAASTVVTNPDATGGNTTSMVGNLTKASGSEVWAGSFLTIDAPIDFSATTTMSIDTWSPKSGVNVLMKLENLDDGDIFQEVQVQNTVADQWETLTFDFSAIDQSQTYQKIVIFFDFGNPGDDSKYYFDNINLQ